MSIKSSSDLLIALTDVDDRILSKVNGVGALNEHRDPDEEVRQLPNSGVLPEIAQANVSSLSNILKPSDRLTAQVPSIAYLIHPSLLLVKFPKTGTVSSDSKGLGLTDGYGTWRAAQCASRAPRFQVTVSSYFVEKHTNKALWRSGYRAGLLSLFLRKIIRCVASKFFWALFLLTSL
ncbi:uncharacterized protein BDR25DRAFT_359461 [Lindgomyces ingoldianus]|uniref:Uncharacterized protein n=1 Tax=Lindgomyces ingoldianus TaxID=673940 RepID=A0ACB6QHV2_9PLEO|nr:uncharacterized protein BDR25DRAFT_359461 [Lindgomyces ingoldianus]KAF2466564.1 hypothetical protein BDR25DRAFT_359461 [Lindgomyces ingoldianus]